jgi:hypothetical protein
MDRITYGPLDSSFIKLIDHHCIKLCAIIQSLEAKLVMKNQEPIP